MLNPIYNIESNALLNSLTTASYRRGGLTESQAYIIGWLISRANHHQITFFGNQHVIIHKCHKDGCTQPNCGGYIFHKQVRNNLVLVHIFAVVPGELTVYLYYVYSIYGLFYG